MKRKEYQKFYRHPENGLHLNFRFLSRHQNMVIRLYNTYIYRYIYIFLLKGSLHIHYI